MRNGMVMSLDNDGDTIDLVSAALETLFANRAEAAEAGDTAEYTVLLLPETTMFFPNRPPLLGRNPIGAFVADLRQSVGPVLDAYDQEQLVVAGDVAMVRSRGVGH